MNLTDGEFRVYNMLKKPEKPMKCPDIARVMNCTPQTILRNLNALIAKGYVERYNGKYYKLKGK